MLATERILGLVVRPAEALVAIPLQTRRFEDLSGYLFEPMMERVGVASSRSVSVGWTDRLVGELDPIWRWGCTALRTLLPYWRGAGIDVRWMVLRGSVEFFRVTKRFHNHLQGQPGDGGLLGFDELTALDRAGDVTPGR